MYPCVACESVHVVMRCACKPTVGGGTRTLALAKDGAAVNGAEAGDLLPAAAHAHALPVRLGVVGLYGAY